MYPGQNRPCTKYRIKLLLFNQLFVKYLFILCKSFVMLHLPIRYLKLFFKLFTRCCDNPVRRTISFSVIPLSINVFINNDHASTHSSLLEQNISFSSKSVTLHTILSTVQYKSLILILKKIKVLKNKYQ